MRDKIINGISAVAFTAFVILFSWYIADKTTPEDLGSISGWWGFGCLLVGVFFSEIED